VIRTVRLEASIPCVTCSAVEADPNPLVPGLPVTNEKKLIFLLTNQSEVDKTQYKTSIFG